MKTIYLAGHSIEFEYREYCMDNYSDKYDLIDPMASVRILEKYDRADIIAQEKVKHEEVIPNETVKSIIDGDKHDIRRSDYIMAYVQKPTFGTVMEIMYAYDHGKKVITVNPTGNWGGDIWLRHHSEVILETIDEAFEYIKNMK